VHLCLFPAFDFFTPKFTSHPALFASIFRHDKWRCAGTHRGLQLAGRPADNHADSRPGGPAPAHRAHRRLHPSQVDGALLRSLDAAQCHRPHGQVRLSQLPCAQFGQQNGEFWLKGCALGEKVWFYMWSKSVHF